MIDIWHTLESAFPKILGSMRAAEQDLAPHPLTQVTHYPRLMDFLIFEDRPLNGTILTETMSRRAYMNPVAMDAQYESLSKQGYTTKHDNGTYTLTDKGREAYLDYFAQRTAAYKPIIIMPQADCDLLIGFLQKGYEAAKHADEPDALPSMVLGHQFYTHIAATGGQLGALLGWINLFELYRDDVHASIWKDADFTGIRIEVLTHIWHDDEHNASKLAEHLAFRGYTETDYQAALDQLVAFGLITTHDDYYTLTEEGREFRNSLEEDTQRIFQDFCIMTYSEQELADFAAVIARLTHDESN